MSADQSAASLVASAIRASMKNKPGTYDYTIVEPEYKGSSLGNRSGIGSKDLTDALHRRVREFESAFGRRVVFVQADRRSPSFFNGFILPKSDPTTIYVNADADVNLISILGHEFYEGLVVTNPTLHSWFLNQAALLLNSGALQTYFNKLTALGDQQNSIGQFKELLADFTGDALADPEFRRSLEQIDKNKFRELIRSFRRFLIHFLGKMRTRITGTGLMGDKTLESNQYFRDIQALRDALREVILKSNSARALTTFLEGGGVMFSRTSQWQEAQEHPEPVPATWQAPETGRWDEATYNFQDRHIDTKRVQQAIEGKNGRLADGMNLRQREELFYGRDAKEVQDFKAKELNPMLEQLGKDGIELAAFEEYLHARHAPEANKVMAERNPNQEMINAGRAQTAQEISALAQLQTKLLKLSPELGAALQAEADKVLGKNTPNPAPWRAKIAGTPEGDWHDVAFVNAPQWLKDAVAKRGALLGGVVQQKGIAKYYLDTDQINMGSLNKNSVADQGTWRHEYGHAMDKQMQIGHPLRSAAPDFTDAMVEDAHELVVLGGHSPKSHKVTQAAIAKLQAAYAGSAQELLQASDKAQWLADRYAKNGLDFSQVQAAMKAQTDFATYLQGADLHDRYARIITAIEQRDAQGLMDALTGGVTTYDGAKEAQKTYEKGTVGNLSDLFGSATSNQVSGRSKSGFGHEDTYYKDLLAGPAECFANLTCFYGDTSPVWGQIIEAMTPRMAQLFKEIMR